MTAVMTADVLTVTDETFEAEVMGSPVPVLVEFWAPWCGPCRSMVTVLDRIAEERAGSLKVVRVDTDSNPLMGARYAIQQVPTMLIIQDGEVVGEVRGQALPKPILDRKLNTALG